MSRFSDEINQRVHNELCHSCPHSKECHEECKTCDDFNDLVQLYLNGQSHLKKENLEKAFLNKKVHVVIRDPWHPIDADGVVTLVDDACQLHGTWGGLAAIPPYDSVILLED